MNGRKTAGLILLVAGVLALAFWLSHLRHPTPAKAPVGKTAAASNAALARPGRPTAPGTPPAVATPRAAAPQPGLRTSPAAAKTNAAPAAAKAGTNTLPTSRLPRPSQTQELIGGIVLLCLAILFLYLAKTWPGPLPGLLKWGCRILGGLYILSALWPLIVGSVALWFFIHFGLWKAARGGEALGMIVQELIGGLLLLGLGAWLVRVTSKRRSQAAKQAPAAPAPVPLRAAMKPLKRKAGTAAIHSCNVLQTGPEARQLWQFDARNGGFVLNRQQTSFAGEQLPAKLVTKDWRSLWQRKLNVAWLPHEHVFLRAAQFPLSDFQETLAMVELQLEKLSPLPVAQICWSLQVLPQTRENMQTVVLMIMARTVVEEFLGQLEGQGYLADRLELPLLDQLQATEIREDGAWIYPETQGGRSTALVAWWYGGTLQNLDLVTLLPANGPANLKEQLLQMAWAGELEGWLTSPPRWHLVAEAPAAAEWGPALRAGLEQSIEVLAPLPTSELAALTAQRAAQADPRANLLPVEFASRYQQQFVDRLWMRGLGTVVALYVVGVVIYFIALQVLLFRTHGVEQQVAAWGPMYTNAIQLKTRYQVLQDTEDLKFAALDCYKAVAELMPESLTLESWNFSEGKSLALVGSAPAGQAEEVFKFEAALRAATANGRPDGRRLFDPNKGEHATTHFTPGAGGAAHVSWSFRLELNRAGLL